MSSGFLFGGQPPAIVSPFSLVLNFDTSVNSAPAGFKPACLAVAALYEKLIFWNGTIVIDVGYGEVNGQGVSGFGQSSYNLLGPTTYSTVRSAFLATVSGPDMTAAAAQLPATDPTGGTAFWVSHACGKALGLTGGVATQGSPDGWVGFATSGFDYGGGPSISGVDFCGTVAHEFAEVMGRFLLCDTSVGGNPAYNLFDMFRYSSSGVRNLGAASSASYFSLDGGVTNLQNFSGSQGGDAGDWSSTDGSDAFTTSASSNVTQPMSVADQRVMAAIGWQTNGAITWNTTGL